MIELLGVWIAAFVTLAIFSFLYKDNPFYKFAEHLFVGVAAGYGLSIEFHNVFIPNLWNPLISGKLLLLLPFALGLLLFMRFVYSISWMSRWALAIMIGAYSGLAIIGAAQGDLVAQIQANLIPFLSKKDIQEFSASPNFFSFLYLIRNPLLVTGLLFTLIYFFFSKEHKGVFGGSAKIGIWFLMVSFGASFGYTVMARVSLLIGRIQFLLSDWLHILK